MSVLNSANTLMQGLGTSFHTTFAATGP